MGEGLLEQVPATDPASLAAAAPAFENAAAEDVVTWATAVFGPRLTLASSFQDVVLLDLAVRADPGIEVAFLDTGAHFAETLEFVEAMRKRYDLNLVVLRPGPDAAPWPCGSARCCELRKVAPLRAHLARRDAWMTGIRRAETATRASAPVVSIDPTFDVVKVNPLARWSDGDVARYLERHRLPLHPLVPRGYPSIGCAPTTSPVLEGSDGRAGRWAGLEKTECGLHG